MKKLIIISVSIVIFSGIAVFVSGSECIVFKIIAVIASGLVGITLQAGFNLINTHGHGMKLWWQSQIKYRNADVRLSFAYLYKIEVEGKYLLVRGHRMKNRYQPIGGVYKYYKEAKPFLESIQYSVDTSVGNTDETDDLRIMIKGKYLLDFLDWFDSMKDREYDPTREFYEEILKPGLLPEDDFRHLHYRKIKIHNVGITRSEAHTIDELIYADIFEVDCTDKQKQEIFKAVEKNNEDIILAKANEMKSRRYGETVEMNLGNNVPWLLGGE